MPREPKLYLEDIEKAAGLIEEFVGGRNFNDYLDSAMLRSAVERQLAIVGEALTQLAQVDLALAQRVPEYRDVIGFRNVVVHGYRGVDDDIVWKTVVRRLPQLRRAVRELLAE